MKKLICIAAAALLLLATVACASPEKEEIISVGISFRRTDDGNAAQYFAYLQTALEQLGMEPVVMDAQNDAHTQKAQIAQLLEQGCRMLVVEPVNGNAILQWQDPRVPVVFIGTEPTDPVLTQWEKACFVGCDPAQEGAVQADIIQQLRNSGDVNEDGAVTYALLQSLSDRTGAKERARNCVDALAAAGVQTHSLGEIYTSGDQGDVEIKCGQLLSRYGKDIEVIICGDSTVLAAAEAVRNGGWVPGQDIWLVGVGAGSEILEELQEGALAGTVADAADEMAQQVAAALQALKDGQAVESRLYVPCAALTPEALDNTQ